MKPAILVARAIFPEVLDRLSQTFEITANQDDVVYTPAELTDKMRGKVGALTTGSERIDAALLAACPSLKVVANMAVGYNNIDIAAARARGIVVTNTPDVLTDATADFAFALILAITRRLGEAERIVRAGRWQRRV